MKMRYAFAGLLAAVAMAGTVPAAVAAPPTAAAPANIYNETAPANIYNEAASAPKVRVAMAGSTAAAASASAAAATCPAPGHRIKVSSDATVYLVGPGNVLYYFYDSTEYFGLYSSYSGITTVSQGVLSACFAGSPQDAAWELPGVLIKTSSSPKVYIADPSYAGGWRWITSQSVFDKYGFDSSKILTGSFSPIAANWS